MHKLNIALDISKISEAEPTGIINLNRLFALACSLLANEDKITLNYTGMQPDKNWLHKNYLLNSSTFHYFRIPGKLQKSIASLKFLPWWSAVARSDIYHAITEYPFSRRKTQVIGTLIDFVPMQLPDHVPVEFTEKQISWCEWAKQHPETKWISISENTKQDALSFSCLREDQIWVVNLCADTYMFDSPSKLRIRRTLDKYYIQQPYLLCVSDLNPRKNHLRLIEAWNRGDFANEGWMLALVGYHADNPIINKINSGEFRNISWLGYVPRDELVNLYYGCEGFVYPSLYEGFGLPVVDAIVAGKAVLTSQNSPMSKMAGSGAICFDPFKVDDILRGLSELILDSSIREERANHNWIQRDYFSIARFAEDLLDIYQAIYTSFVKNRDNNNL